MSIWFHHVLAVYLRRPGSGCSSTAPVVSVCAAVLDRVFAPGPSFISDVARLDQHDIVSTLFLDDVLPSNADLIL